MNMVELRFWSECIKVPARGNRQKNIEVLSFKYPRTKLWSQIA